MALQVFIKYTFCNFANGHDRGVYAFYYSFSETGAPQAGRSGVRKRQNIFPCASWLAVGPTHSRIQWVPGFFPGGNVAWAWVDHSHTSSAKVNNDCCYNCTPLHACILWRGTNDIYCSSLLSPVSNSSNGGPSLGHGLWTEVEDRVEYREEGSMKLSRNVGSVWVRRWKKRGRKVGKN